MTSGDVDPAARPVRAGQIVDVLRAAPLFWAGPLLRPWHLHWGATPDEVRYAMPGDDLIHGAQLVATRAITIEAGADSVWPWICQVGFRRAGFYSYDLLDNLGRPSAETIVSELQDLAIGDRIAMAEPVTDMTAFRVAGLARPRWMLWHKPDSTWAWWLEASPDGGTRLITRLRQRYDLDRPVGALASLFLMEFGDFPMMRRMLLGLKRRAEATEGKACLTDGHTSR